MRMLSVPSTVAVTPPGAAGPLAPPSSVMLPGGVAGRALMSARMFVVACWMRRSGSPSFEGFIARPRFHQFVPVVTTVAPLAALYLTMVDTVEPGVWFCPKFWIRLPVTGDAASVLVPPGSAPFVARASHAQPTMFEPIETDVPGASVSRPVY